MALEIHTEAQGPAPASIMLLKNLWGVTEKMKMRIRSLAILLIVIATLLCACSSIRVDNSEPAYNLIRHEYSQEDFLTVQAIFHVQRSFHSVSAKYLCGYAGMTLECKREIDDGNDYYVFLDDNIRCFVFVDSSDTVKEVLVVYRFSTIEEIQARISNEDPYSTFPNADDDRASVDLGKTDTNENTVLYFLSDGVVAATFYDAGSRPSFRIYSDDEWLDVYKDYGGYLILSIDKQ